MKYKEKKNGKVFVRHISLGAMGRAHQPEKKEKKRQRMELAVKGFRRGEMLLTADDGKEYSCRREYTLGALIGDRVLAEPMGFDRVAVRKILVHAHEHIVGVLRRVHGRYIVQAMERRMPAEIVIRGDVTNAEENDIVLVKVVRWEDEGGLLGVVETRVGCFDRARAALDALIVSENLRNEFDEDVMEQADACRPAGLADDEGREDLRDILSFTIDGEHAKDFDDAVSLKSLENGALLLGVHIADVGHYVPVGTPLDREAFARGTSIYMPGRVLPMLPEQLSNGVCSLRPDEDKFTMSALMTFGADGICRDFRLARTIIRSKARLVYTHVNRLFDGDANAVSPVEGLSETLFAMRGLARAIRARRQEAGCIDFETDEPEFILDDEGEPIDMVKRARGEAEMMIEDFMLAANECVARFARENGVPLLYRVHEEPDGEKLSAFADFLGGIGVNAEKIRGGAKPMQMRELLESTKDRPEHGVISMLALRAMQKARYDAQPLGHYGLAMADYCHFTSPIRRYPDLVVSRAITAKLTGRDVPTKGAVLEEAAKRSSDCERAAIDAERTAEKLMMARFMRRHVGEKFTGEVSGVTEFGVYVQLENGAEGFIHVRGLNDWFQFDERRMLLRGERTGVVFSFGQKLDIRVANVEVTTGAVDFELVGELRAMQHGAKKPENQKSERKRERARMRGFGRY